MAANGVEKLNVDSILKYLELDKPTGVQKQKIQQILNKIYKSKDVVMPDVVIDAVSKIYIADPDFTAVDDIYIITYGGMVKLEFKYTFWPKKLIEYNVFKTVDAYVVREGEEFTITIDNGQTQIFHKANPFNNNSKIIGTYARGVLPDGSVVIATASAKELELAQKAAKVKSKGKPTVWDTWFEEVAKKVPLKRLVKMIPTPDSLKRAEEIDNDNYATPEEINKKQEVDNTYSAIEELNQEVENTCKQEEVVTLKQALDDLGIRYEMVNGWIKAAKNDIGENFIQQLKLIPFKKDNNFVVGKGDTPVDYELYKGENVEIVYE